MTRQTRPDRFGRPPYGNGSSQPRRTSGLGHPDVDWVRGPRRSNGRQDSRLARPDRRRLAVRRSVAGAAVLAVLAVVVGVPAVNLMSPSPRPAVLVATVHPDLAATRSVPSSPVSLPWPATGEAAVAIPTVGYATQSGSEQPVPIASMTKVMTAYIVLRDHPLTGDQSGPDITITPADAADYATDTVTDQSSVEVTAGEVLTERQMIDAMLVHSANDLAYALACWDAGSLGAFVAKMNATAAALGMTQTHYADASGFTPQSVSTAADLLKVTTVAMEEPAFAQAVSMPSYTVPVAGTVATYTPLLQGSTGGVPGVVGVKSGFTTAAGGGDILAYESSVDGRSVEALAVVTSQQGPNVLQRCGEIDLGLAQAALAAVEAVQPLSAGDRVATVGLGHRHVPGVVASAGSVLAMPGQQVTETLVVTHRPKLGARAGFSVGTVLLTLGQQQVALPVRTSERL
ncbi:MAG: hypothetical protein M0Z95_12845 [Actinomycetota bacterium]|nr:hypothetical protein [Actinomycetota bacterium]